MIQTTVQSVPGKNTVVKAVKGADIRIPSEMLTIANRIGELIGKAATHQWELGCLYLKWQKKGGTFAQLRAKLGVHCPEQRRFQEWSSVCREFPEEKRSDDVPFSSYLTAVEQAKNFPTIGSADEVLRHVRNPDETILKRCIRNGKAPISLSKRRDARKYCAKLALEIMQKSQPPAPRLKAEDSIRQHCHHLPSEKYAAMVPDDAATLIHLDPPYGDYDHCKSGIYSTDGIYTGFDDCDNGNTELSLATTKANLIAWAAKLDPQRGVLLLWQNYKIIRREILEAIEEAGLIGRYPLIWRKKNHKPGDFGAWTTSIEQCYVLTRSQFRIENFDDSNRNQILEFDCVRQRTEETHLFQKPDDMMRYLISKITLPGDLVIDAFGCTGVLSIQAAKLRRRWEYIESNRANYERGTERIVREVSGIKPIESESK